MMSTDNEMVPTTTESGDTAVLAPEVEKRPVDRYKPHYT